MKFAAIIGTVIFLSASPLLAADKCQNYINTQLRMQLAGHKAEMELLGTKVAKMQAEQAFLEKDTKFRVDELLRESRIKDQVIMVLEEEKGKFWKEFKQWEAEMLSGLYCSQCKRSKSQIEKEDGESFARHLKGVSGTQLPASREMIQKGFKKYLEKRDKATEKIVNIFHYQDKLDDKMAALEEPVKKKRVVLKVYEDELAKGRLKEIDLKHAMAEEGCYLNR